MSSAMYVVQRLADRSSPAITEDDPGLLALAESARHLIGVLEAGAKVGALCGPVATYVMRAAAQGISRERIHAALELLVHDHAVLDRDRADRESAAGRRAPLSAAARRQATAEVLDFVLRLASDAAPS